MDSGDNLSLEEEQEICAKLVGVQEILDKVKDQVEKIARKKFRTYQINYQLDKPPPDPKSEKGVTKTGFKHNTSLKLEVKVGENEYIEVKILMDYIGKPPYQVEYVKFK